MPTLTIEGQRVTVDDSFLALSPEEQNATVDEIARSLKLKEPKKAEPTDTLSKVRVGSGGMVEGIPVVGPLLRRGAEMAAAATLAPFSDMDYSEILAEIDAETAREKEANPVLDIGSQVAGATLAVAPIAATSAGATALGLKGKHVASRAVAAGLTGGGAGAADQVARNTVAGDDLGDDLKRATLVSGGVGAAAPVVGHVASKVADPLASAVKSLVRGSAKPGKEAAKRVGKALEADRLAGQDMLGPLELESAARNQQPIVNADRGGEATRALARAAANQSPEARGAITRLAEDRFADQSGRVVGLVNRVTGGQVDDLAAKDAIIDAARKANKPAYDRAFANPKAKSLFTPTMQELMQSPSFRVAVKQVPKRSADRGAIDGFKQLPNPFETNSKGQFVLRKKADGTLVSPSLEFWNQVKINLDGMIGRAQRAGDKTLAGDLVALKKKLISELDTAVPHYKNARQGAAAFFGTENALEAGRKFAKSTRMVPEFKKGLALMKPAEREAFKVGYASELIDIARSSNDRTNTIRQMFMTPESREKIVLAFGKDKAREFETFVRVENVMDMLRGSMGNSTTVRQLIETGTIGGAGWMVTGDFTTGVAAAAVGGGARMAGKKINERVLRKTADMLLSNDPKLIDQAVKAATVSPQHMAALDAISQVIGVAARAGGLQHHQVQ